MCCELEGQIILYDGIPWVCCGWCGKKQFPISPDTIIKGLRYCCKGCREMFTINVPQIDTAAAYSTAAILKKEIE